MARIPEQQVTRLKTEVSIVRLVEAAGIELKKHGGADLVGRCPFHDDRTPSLVVSPEKNLWHCLGACGVGGSVIDWVMRFHKVSFRHACELLLKDHPACGWRTGRRQRHLKCARPSTDRRRQRAIQSSGVVPRNRSWTWEPKTVNRPARSIGLSPA